MANGRIQSAGGSPFRANQGAEIIQGIGNILQQFQGGQQLAQAREQAQKSQLLQDLFVQSQTGATTALAEQRRNPLVKQRSFSDIINEQKFTVLAKILDPETPPEQVSILKEQLKSFSSPGTTVNVGEGEGFSKQFDRGFKLSGQFKADPIVKTFPEIQKSVDNMEAAFAAFQADPSTFVAIDQALISSFNKILDPGSVVRESEFERTGKSLGISQQLIGSLVKLAKGGAGLTSPDRAALVSLARDLRARAEGRFNEKIAEFEAKAVQARVPRDFVLGGIKPFGGAVGPSTQQELPSGDNTVDKVADKFGL